MKVLAELLTDTVGLTLAEKERRKLGYCQYVMPSGMQCRKWAEVKTTIVLDPNRLTWESQIACKFRIVTCVRHKPEQR
jgi:hypothetical protein